jgi:ribosomal protein L11 methyltransferase
LRYLEIKINTPTEYYDILIAELSAIGYDSFMEEGDALLAYVDEQVFKEEDLKSILSKYNPGSISYSFHKMEDKNWNEEWEKNFQPVEIGNECIIRASFHKIDPKYRYDIIINPKMSFGTGHHETTHMMVENQLEIGHTGKKVMDAGSGTGILAILASKLGAEHVMAFDVEDWAFENLKENINLNNCSNIQAAQGTVQSVRFPYNKYDIVLANINKNVLMNEIPIYVKIMSEKGILVVSGFYEEDIKDIEGVCTSVHLKKVKQKIINKWASLVCEKI